MIEKPETPVAEFVGVEMRSHTIEVFPTTCTELDFLKPSVNSMFDVIDQFVDRECGNNRVRLPYWSNERAMLSQFIGGVWRADKSNYALEEFSCTKPGVESKYKGRRDAWFCAGGEKCYVEAKLPKYAWSAARRFTDQFAVANLNCALWEAKQAEPDGEIPDWCMTDCLPSQDVDSLVGDDQSLEPAVRSLGMVFVVPRISRKNQKQGESIYATYASTPRRAATRFADEKHCRVLWGRYFRQSLLQDSGFDWSPYWEKWISTPVLDLLICEHLNDPRHVNQT